MANNMGRVSLGVVAICYNEEQDLPGFLEHLLPWVDEIVIVDDGSTDRSQEIAQAAGDKVHWINSPRKAGEYYADQRNKGIDASTCDWLLHMDIDERVTPQLAREILHAIRNPNFDAYRFRRLNYFLHRPLKRGGGGDWNREHLARRDCLRFSGMYHEEICLYVPPSRIGQLYGYMLHLNDRSYEERLWKSDRYQHELAQRIVDKKGHVNALHIVSSFVAEFVYKYVWKLGFLDGSIGLIWALHCASARMRAHMIVWDNIHRISRDELEERVRLMWDETTINDIVKIKKYGYDSDK